jgi:hypothetical protein
MKDEGGRALPHKSKYQSIYEASGVSASKVLTDNDNQNKNAISGEASQGC